MKNTRFWSRLLKPLEISVFWVFALIWSTSLGGCVTDNGDHIAVKYGGPDPTPQDTVKAKYGAPTDSLKAWYGAPLPKDTLIARYGAPVPTDSIVAKYGAPVPAGSVVAEYGTPSSISPDGVSKKKDDA
jgi:hypothetical protein